jgi:hypothetical protein
MSQELLEPLSVQSNNPYTYQCVEHVRDVAAAIQAATAQTPQVALVTITLYFLNRERAAAATKYSAHYFLDQIRPLTRKTDIVLLQHHTCYFILPGANLQGAQIVQERLWDALLWRVHSTEERQVIRPWSITIGHSAFPDPYRHPQDCIAAAHEAQFSLNLKPQEFSPVRAETPEADLPMLARRLGVPYLHFLPRALPGRLKELISPQLAQELHCYPLGCERNILTVAMANPSDRNALNRLSTITGMRIFPVLAHPQTLAIALEQFQSFSVSSGF